MAPGREVASAISVKMSGRGLTGLVACGLTDWFG